MVKSLSRRFSRKNSKSSFRRNSKKVSRRNSKRNTKKIIKRNTRQNSISNSKRRRFKKTMKGGDGSIEPDRDSIEALYAQVDRQYKMARNAERLANKAGVASESKVKATDAGGVGGYASIDNAGGRGSDRMYASIHNAGGGGTEPYYDSIDNAGGRGSDRTYASIDNAGGIKPEWTAPVELDPPDQIEHQYFDKLDTYNQRIAGRIARAKARRNQIKLSAAGAVTAKEDAKGAAPPPALPPRAYAPPMKKIGDDWYLGRLKLDEAQRYWYIDDHPLKPATREQMDRVTAAK